MWTAVVAEKEPFAVFHVLRRVLGEDIRCRRAPWNGIPEPLPKSDVFIVAGEQVSPSRCRAAVVPGESEPTPLADYVVTYGLSQRDTLTISSAVDRDVVLALQRDLVDVRGRRTDRQEILLRRPAHLGLGQTLACVGGFLVLGIEIEKIPGLLATGQQRPVLRIH